VSYVLLSSLRVSRNTRLPRLTPRHSHGVHLKRAWERCRRLLFGARSTLRCVAGRLAFPASSLALPPTRLAPDGDGPSRSFASRRWSPGIAAKGPSTHSSAPLRSSHLLPGPAHADLLSWGRTGRTGFPGRLAPSPLRQLCTFSRRTVARPLPARNRGSRPSAFGCQSESPVPTAWYLTTSPGFSALRLAGLLHPAADPGVRRVSHGPAEASRDPRDATTPRRMLPSARGTPVTRSPGPRGVRPRWLRIDASLLTMSRRLVARPAPSRLYPCGWSVTSTLVADCRRSVLPGLLSPLRGHADHVAGRATPVTEGRPPDAPTIVTPSKLGVDWRDAGVDGPGR